MSSLNEDLNEFKVLKQMYMEPFEEFVERAKNLAIACGFCDVDEMVKNKIIEGCYQHKLRGIVEKTKVNGEITISLKDLIICGKNLGDQYTTNKEEICTRCGSTKHVSIYKQCPARDNICSHCEKRGHYSAVCKRKNLNLNQTKNEPSKDSSSKTPNNNPAKRANDGGLTNSTSRKRNNEETLYSKIPKNEPQVSHTKRPKNEIETRDSSSKSKSPKNDMQGSSINRQNNESELSTSKRPNNEPEASSSKRLQNMSQNSSSKKAEEFSRNTLKSELKNSYPKIAKSQPETFTTNKLEMKTEDFSSKTPNNAPQNLTPNNAPQNLSTTLIQSQDGSPKISGNDAQSTSKRPNNEPECASPKRMKNDSQDFATKTIKIEPSEVIFLKSSKLELDDLPSMKPKNDLSLKRPKDEHSENYSSKKLQNERKDSESKKPDNDPSASSSSTIPRNGEKNEMLTTVGPNVASSKQMKSIKIFGRNKKEFDVQACVSDKYLVNVISNELLEALKDNNFVEHTGENVPLEIAGTQFLGVFVGMVTKEVAIKCIQFFVIKSNENCVTITRQIAKCLNI